MVARKAPDRGADLSNTGKKLGWKNYQEEAAEFFRSLGFAATTDATIKGTRTKHDVDVLVTSKISGFDVTWIVECKHWKSRVGKLHVLGLRQIVVDAGADRGILLSESGFQAGAFEAANLTNVQVTSLASLRSETEESVCALQLGDLLVRIQKAEEEYWEIDKADRIKFGLRGDLDPAAYSGDHVIQLVTSVINQASCNVFPFEVRDYMRAVFVQSVVRPNFPMIFENKKQVLDVLEPLVDELEAKLETAFRGLSADT